MRAVIESVMVAGTLLVITVLIAQRIYGKYWEEGRRARAQQERYTAERAVRAVRRGWRYECYLGRDRQGDICYRIFGAARDFAWIIEYHSDQTSSSPRPSLVFHVPTLASGRIEWRILDAAHRDLSGSTWHAMQSAALRLAARVSTNADDSRKFRDEARDIDAGTAVFRRRYVVFGRSSKAVMLLVPEAEALMLDWPAVIPIKHAGAPFSASMDHHGMILTLYVDGPAFEVIERLVRLGELLVEGALRMK